MFIQHERSNGTLVYGSVSWALEKRLQVKAADTFVETIVAVLMVILVPRIVRVLLDMDTSGSWGLFTIACYFAACAGVIYAEYVLIVKWFGVG